MAGIALFPFALLQLRWRVAAHVVRQNPSRLVSTLLALFVAGPAALAAGQRVKGQLATLPPAQTSGFLGLALLVLQAVLLALLLLPEGVLSLSRGVPTPVLRPFPVRPYRLVLAAVVGGLLDLPLLLALLTLTSVAQSASPGSPLPSSLPALLSAGVALVLLLLQTGMIAQTLEHAAALLSRQRRTSIGLLLTGALLVGLCFCLTPAVGATTPPPIHRQAQPATPAVSAPPTLTGAATFLPSGLAARGIVAATQQSWGAAFGWTALLAATTAGWGTIATVLFTAALRRDTGAAASVRRAPPRAREIPAVLRPMSGQLAVLVHTEWHQMTRNPGAHLPLRSPAQLLLAVILGLILSNNSTDAIRNLRDIVGIIGALSVVLWQVQLLCNRFGNEAGTARLLFGFPVARHRLLLGRNVALLMALLLADGLLLIGGSLSAHVPAQNIAGFLAWLVAVLVLATGFGNVVSVCAAFPIRDPNQATRQEPERSLAFVYAGFCLAVAGACWPIHLALVSVQSAGANLFATVGVLIGAAGYLALVYAGTLQIAVRLLARRESQIVARLDGKE